MLIISHRGAMAYEPENTLRSMKKALTFDIDYIEFDVHVTKDGALVVIHDDTVDRTTNGKGFVADMTLDQIKKLDAGKGEQVPTLQEVLHCIDRKVKVLVEIAGFLPAAEKVADVINQYVEEKGWHYDDFMVCSFKHAELKRFHALIPQIPLVACTSGVPLSYAKMAEEVGAQYVATENLYLGDDAFIKDAHARNIKFILYTIDEPEYLDRYKSFGIDGVITNAPDKLHLR